MASNKPDIFFSLGVDEAELKALEKRLQTTVDTLQKALTLKNEPLTPALKSIGDAAQKSVKPLSDLEKASKSLAAAQKVIIAEQRAGLVTSDQAISKLKGLSTEYGKTYKAANTAEKGYEGLASALGTTVTATGKLEAAQVKSQKALQADTTRKYKDAQNNLRTELERGAISVDRYRVEANDLQNEMVELRDTLPRTSKEFGDLDRVIGQNTRGITTAEGRVSKLGLSQQVALGHTQRLGGGIRTLGVGVVGLGNVLPGVIGIAGLGGLLSVSTDLAKQADKTNIAQQVLNATIERTGQDAGAVQEAISNTAAALKLTDAQVSDSAATLLRLGLNAEQIEDGLIAAGSSALAFGTTSAQGIESFTSALATGNSQALNTIGIAENIGKVMNEASEAHAGAGESAQKQASATAGLNVVLKATESEVELLDTLTGGLAGKQADSARAAFEARQAFGEMLIPLETLKNEVLVGVLGQFTEMPSATQASVLGIGGVTTGVAALATGLTALRPLLAATFLPPAGLIVLGVAAAAALGTAIYTLGNGALKGAAAEVDNLKTSLETSAQGFATAKAAVIELQDVTDENGFLGVVETLASTLDEKGASSLRAFAESTALPLIAQGELQKALELTVEKFGVFEAEAARAGLQGAEQQIELSRNRVNLLEREITYLEQLANGDFSYAGLNPTPSDIQALNNYEGQLVSVKTQMQTSQVAADGYRGQLKTVQDAQAALNDESLTSEERLAGFAEALGVASDFSVQASENLQATGESGAAAADGVTEVTDAVTESGDAAETSAERGRELTTAYENLSPALRDVVNAQIQFQDVMKAAGGDSIIVGVSAAVDIFGALERELLAGRQAYALNQDAATEWAKVYEAAYGDAGAAATEAAELEQEAFFDRAKSRDAIVEANERAAESASVYDDAAQTVYTTQDAAIAQNENSIASLRDLMTAQRDFNERLEVSGGLWKDVTPEASDFSTALAKLNAEAVRADDVLRNYAEGVLEDLPDAYRDAEAENDLFNTGLSTAEVRAGVARAALQNLIDQGLDPQSDAVIAVAEEWQSYQTEVDAATELSEALTEAQEGLADGASLTQADIDGLRTSLLGTADATGELSVDAQGLLSDLNALDVAQELSTGFGVIGDSARTALDGIPGLSDAAKGGLQGIANASDEMSTALKDGVVTPQEGIAALGGLVDGLADGFRDDLSPGAYAAVKAIDGVASAAVSFATGDIVGGVTALISTAVSGIADYFQEAQREAEELLAIAKQIDDALKDSQERTRDLKLGSAFDQNELEFDTGQIDELAFIIRNTQLKLIEEQLEFNEALEDAGRRRGEALVGVTNPDDIDRINAGFDAEERALKEGHDTNRATIVEGGRAEAEAAEYTNQEFLGGLTQTDALIEGAYGNSGASFFAAVDNYKNVAVGAINDAGTDLSAAGTQMGSTASVGIQGGGTAIGASTLSAFTGFRGLLGTETSTTLTAQGTASTTLSGGFAGIFDRSQTAITAAYPGTTGALGTAFGSIFSLTGERSLSLKDKLYFHEQQLAERQKQLFYQQEVAAGKYGPLAKAELEKQLKNERTALYNAVSGGGGLLSTLATGETDVTNALSSFFGSQRTTVSTQGGRTVTDIDDAAGDIRAAMRRLAAAGTFNKKISAGGGSGGGGGGGSGGRGIQGFFAPMHSFVDDRALGGMGDGFGTLDTWGIAAETERNQFGFGTSFSQPVQPVGDSYQGGRNRAGALSGLLQSVRADVEGYKLGVVSSVNAARKTTAKAFASLRDMVRAEDGSLVPKSFYKIPEGYVRAEDGSLVPKTFYDMVRAEDGSWVPKSFYDAPAGKNFTAYNYDFRKGLIDEAKRNGKAVKKTKDEYAEMKKDFLGTFDFLSGRSLLKSIGGVKSPLFDLAKDIGSQVESGFKSGLTDGAQGFIFGTGGIQESLARMTFDTTVNSLLTTVLSSGLLEKLFDGAYTNLTEKLVQGDIQGAIEAMKGVLGKLPQVTGQLEQIFAPLRDAAKGLGFYEGAQAPQYENLGQSIKLEARSLGSATPNWVLDMGRYFDTFGKAADLSYKAALIMDRAARRIDSGTRLYEVNNPQKLV